LNDNVTTRRTLIASAGAVVSLAAASSCCLPLIPFLAAAGTAGSSVFLSAMRPYLLLISAALIGYGFYQGRKARQCDRRTSRVSTILLWSSAGIIFVSVVFPQVVAGLLAG